MAGGRQVYQNCPTRYITQKKNTDLRVFILECETAITTTKFDSKENQSELENNVPTPVTKNMVEMEEDDIAVIDDTHYESDNMFWNHTTGFASGTISMKI